MRTRLAGAFVEWGVVAMASVYAWIIDTDHLAEPDDSYGPSEGVTGPKDAPVELLDQLQGDADAGYTFKMYDDDGELYYTGRMLAVEGEEFSEEACWGPLGDFGGPVAGAVRIDYVGHSEMNCG